MNYSGVEPEHGFIVVFAIGCKYWRNKNGALSGIKPPNKMYCSLLAFEWCLAINIDFITKIERHFLLSASAATIYRK